MGTSGYTRERSRRESARICLSTLAREVSARDHEDENGHHSCRRLPFVRHRLHGYLAQWVPSIFLASSFTRCLNCEALVKACFPGGLGTHEARYPLSRCRTRIIYIYIYIMCVYVYIYVYMYTCVHIYIYIYIHTFNYVILCIHVMYSYYSGRDVRAAAGGHRIMIQYTIT